MADRTLREINRALEQRLNEYARKLEVLRNRSLNGAIRTGYTASVTPPTQDRTPLTSIEVPSGRWAISVCSVVFGATTLTEPLDVWHLSTTARAIDGDPLVGVEVVEPHASMTPAWIPVAGALPGAVQMTSIGTLTGVGWIDAPEQFFLSIDGWTEDADIGATWTECRLVLHPR